MAEKRQSLLQIAYEVANATDIAGRIDIGRSNTEVRTNIVIYRKSMQAISISFFYLYNNFLTLLFCKW